MKGSIARFERYLERAGPQPSAVIRRELGVSPATLHRLRQASKRIVVQGRARATRLALGRTIPGVRTPILAFRSPLLGGAATMCFAI